MYDLFLNIPNSTEVLRPGNQVRLGRFSNDIWTVQFGWYEFGGNRPVCGWYLTKDGGLVVKPIQLPDLDDIFMIQYNRDWSPMPPYPPCPPIPPCNPECNCSCDCNNNSTGEETDGN